MRRDPDREVQGVKDEAIEEIIRNHFDLFSRLADSDLPIARDASNAIEWYCENSDDPEQERLDYTQ